MSTADRESGEAPWLLRVDTGGTFTDGWARDPAGRESRCKVLSSGVLRCRVLECPSPRRLVLSSAFGAAEGVLEGFHLQSGRKVTGWWPESFLLETAEDHGQVPGGLVELSTGEEAPVVAARLLTGTRPGRDFPPLELRLATTRGTNALLERTGAPGVLLVTEGFEDLLIVRDQRRPDLFALHQEKPAPVLPRSLGVRERIGADGAVLEKLDEEHLRGVVETLSAMGAPVVAVALLNSYANPAHELRIREVLREAGLHSCSLSHLLSERVRLLPRAETAAANAYLEPVMARFVSRVHEALGEARLDLMTSAGFLKAAEDYRPIDSLLSGPAGGVVGALAAAVATGRSRVLAFDMGGTSTDVARLDGRPSYRHEQAIGPVRVMAPAVRIETVAAGGGSICQWRLGGLEVGPESAGADPGPACYGRGGPMTITDVNLLLGCMDAEKAGIPLEAGLSQAALEGLKAEMRAGGAAVAEDHILLEGLRQIAVERMAEAIRRVSVREGYDPAEYVLVAFGGAGPQHACAVAEKLGVGEILVPGDAGLLSAWGLHRSAREAIAERQILRELDAWGAELEGSWGELEMRAVAGLGGAARPVRWLAEMRLLGQDAAIELEFADRPALGRLCLAFAERYERLYGYPVPATRAVEVVALRVVGAEPAVAGEQEVFGPAGAAGSGRRVEQDAFRTCVIEEGWCAAVGNRGSLLLSLARGGNRAAGARTPQVEEELFRARFGGVVEEMGELLQRTALSTNIRERLDFSCALLDGEGRLVVNAPHIPVHLGALGLCVREVSKGRRWSDGDMLVVNHPGFGGSHLPDVTVISPVFDQEGGLLGFVANRAHHAEIGGLTPGSMPAAARCLQEEGVVLAPTLLFAGGRSCFEAVEALFLAAEYPSRCLEDNLADLAAQAAANRHGATMLRALADHHGAELVRRNMAQLYARAAAVMRGRIARLGTVVCRYADAMDDGTPVAVEIRGDGRRLVVDFTGSGPVHPGNLNAVPAIVRSAVLYVLRAWAAEPVPLNEGLLEDVDLIIPPGILNPVFSDDPAECPAVVGGNVETSQRVVDVLLAALGLQANGQGTMNNILFGNDSFGYYETLGGGSGAGLGWNGMSGTHVHMSNTAITDPEILERRFPVRVRRFGLRKGSGGRGKWVGGEGLVREFEFLERMTVSLLTQRRLLAPQGMHGGGEGARGRQLWLHADGREEELPGIITLEVEPGDRILLETPGGGGWGEGDGQRDAGG